MNQRALLISPFFYPEPISTGKYNTALTSGLLSASMHVEVICLHPLYPTWKPQFTSIQFQNSVAHRGGGWLRFPKGQIIRRALLELYFALYVLSSLRTLRRNWDVVIFICPPSLFTLAANLILRRSVSRVGIIHDLQGVYSSYKKSPTRALVAKTINFVEKSAFKSFNKTIFLSDQMKKTAISALGLNGSELYVYYPFVTIPKFVNHGRLSGILDDSKNNLVYSGALGEKHGPERLVDLFLAAVNSNDSIEAHVFSSGPIFENMRRRYTGMGRLCFHNLVAEEDLPELLLRSTIQFIPQEPGTSEGSLPSKLPNLLAASCKVIAITSPNGDLARIIDQYSLGRCAYSWDTNILLELINDLLVADNQPLPVDHELLELFSLEKLVHEITS